MANHGGIGGGARKVEISLHELGEKLDRAFEMGVEAGQEAERKLARLKEANNCPMCALLEEHAEAMQRMRILEQRPTGRRFG